MDGGQINNILNGMEETRHYFKGCYINKNLPKWFANIENGFIIVNTLNDANKIGHWILFFIKNMHLYYFDSFGNNPNNYGYRTSKFYNTYPKNKTIVFNSPVQADFSYFCGAYVIYFSYMMCLDYSTGFIKNKFTNNKKNNDKVVSRFVYKKSGIEHTCNSFFCPSYMFLTRCRQFCSC